MSDSGFAMPGGAGLRLGSGHPADTSSDKVELQRKTFVWTDLLKWAFSFPAMLGALLIGRVFCEARAFFVDPDIWWHIKAGQDILATHHWPTTDPYSSTVAGQPWLAYEWLGEVLLAAVARLGGNRGLDVFLIVWASIVMLAIYYYATLRSGNSKAGFISATVLASLAFASFTLRPQMVAGLYLVITLITLEFFRKGRRGVLWILPPLFLLWVNTHGSWVIGLGVVFVTLTSGLWAFRIGGLEARRWSPRERIQLELALLGSLAVLPLTPYGIETVAYPFEVASKLPLGVASVSEWQSMPFNLVGGKIFLGLLLFFMVVQVLYAFAWRLDELALALFAIMMACLHTRFLLIFVPLFAPILATVVARWVPIYEKKKDRHVLNAILMAGVAVSLVVYFPTEAQIRERVAKRFPVETTKYLLAHPVSGRLYNSYGFGGYLIGAGQKVFVDGRADPYERGGALADYLAIEHLKPEAFWLLDAYRVTACLVHPDEALAAALASSPKWTKVNSDKASVLFVRKEPLRNLTATLPARGGEQ